MLVALYMRLGNQGYVHARAAGSTTMYSIITRLTTRAVRRKTWLPTDIFTIALHTRSVASG